MNLTKLIIKQTSEQGWGTETRFMITANYDPSKSEMELVSVIVESNRIYREGSAVAHMNLTSVIDITHMLEYFPSWDYEILEMDWSKEISEAKEERRAA